jgi:alkanesulfonate monooxygenase SsuD/methylene tetrahydromethanopterin reductase-like flavin-dependent oxidoreductase (luciferase family)
VKIGIGLPSTVPGVTRGELLDWASRSEERGFSSLGVIDRLLYPNYEPLLALAAVAAVTERIGLTTSILIAPYRVNTTLLAKQILTLTCLSEGRLVVGLGIGARADDYAVSGLPTARRGARLDEQIVEIRRSLRSGEEPAAGTMGPAPARDQVPPILVGGHSEASLRRAVGLGDGWIGGGSSPDAFRTGAAEVRRRWTESNRPRAPRLMALAFFALGRDGPECAHRFITHYYAWRGADAPRMAAAVPTSEGGVRDFCRRYAEAGCGEVLFFPCSSAVGQVDLLAEALL